MFAILIYHVWIKCFKCFNYFMCCRIISFKLQRFNLLSKQTDFSGEKCGSVKFRGENEKPSRVLFNAHGGTSHEKWICYDLLSRQTDFSFEERVPVKFPRENDGFLFFQYVVFNWYPSTQWWLVSFFKKKKKNYRKLLPFPFGVESSSRPRLLRPLTTYCFL